MTYTIEDIKEMRKNHSNATLMDGKLFYPYRGFADERTAGSVIDFLLEKLELTQESERVAWKAVKGHENFIDALRKLTAEHVEEAGIDKTCGGG